jgi:RND family efflux transporter MFP subunit
MKTQFYKPGMALSVLASMLIFSSCGEKKKESTEKKNDSEIVLEAISLKKEKISSELRLPGELEGYYETGIMAKVNGYIKSMKVDIGDRVKEGQLMAELEAPELISQLTSAFAEYQSKEAVFLNTKGKYNRLKLTNKTPGAVSPYDMDLAKTSFISDSLGFLASKSKYEAVRQLADYLKITAPFDGVITERALAPGAFVGPNDKQGMPLYRLKKESTLRLHIAVPEKYLAEVHVGEVVKFQVKSYPDETFQGKITRLSNSLNIQTRSEIVEIEISNPSNKLLPGMYAIATIPISRPGLSFVVPTTAVVTNMEEQFVIRVKDNQEAEHVRVEKGEEKDGRVEIFGNINTGDTILKIASDEVHNKEKVKIILAKNNIAGND